MTSPARTGNAGIGAEDDDRPKSSVIAGVAGAPFRPRRAAAEDRGDDERANSDDLIQRLDLVRREELDAVQELAANARVAKEAAEARAATLKAGRRPLKPASPPWSPPTGTASSRRRRLPDLTPDPALWRFGPPHACRQPAPPSHGGRRPVSAPSVSPECTKSRMKPARVSAQIARDAPCGRDQHMNRLDQSANSGTRVQNAPRFETAQG